MRLAAASVHARVLKEVVGCQRLVLVADKEGLQEGTGGSRQDRKVQGGWERKQAWCRSGRLGLQLGRQRCARMTTGACRLYRPTASTAMQDGGPGWEQQEPRTSMQASRGKPSCSSLQKREGQHGGAVMYRGLDWSGAGL